MFNNCRDYLIAKLKLIGITDVRTERGAASGVRQASVYSMPSRGRASNQFDLQQETVKQYTDPDDKVPVRVSGTTDAADNTLTAVKDSDADFTAAGVVANDIFINVATNKRALVVTKTDKNNLVLAAPGAGGNAVLYRICDHHGRPKIRKRVKKTDLSITFVVEFQNRNLALANLDFLNFNRALDKFLHDGQYAKYITGSTITEDTTGNKIRIMPGAVEFGDNSYYPELQNKIIMEVEFSGGIFLDPDPASGEIEFDASAVAPQMHIDVET